MRQTLFFVFSGFVAQSVEHLPFKQVVPGSNPGGPTSLHIYEKGPFFMPIFYF
jgi:hypothetical protein